LPDQPIAYVQIKDPEGKLSRAPVYSDRVVIGRSAKADISLPRESISRQHAELVRDPFGRWLIRDMGSRSGIKVRGEAVKQSILRFGDKFELGRYELKLWNLRPIAERPRQTAAVLPELPANESPHDKVSSLADVEPPKIDTLHLTTLTEFGQRLVDVEDPDERLRMLCRFMVRKDFHCLAAMALRLDKRNPNDPPQVLCEPQLALGWDRDTSYVSRGLIRAVRTTRAPVLANNIAMTAPAGAIELSIAPESAGHMAAVACPIADEENTMDALYAVLPPEYGTPEWLAIIALAATQYQQAESIWVARHEAQNNAAIEQDLANARKIQERLMPRNISIDRVDFSVAYQPCEWVGGDYVDVVRMKDGRIFFAIADVSGHGLPSALIALTLHSMVHTYLRNASDLAGMMTVINEHLCEYLESGTFATMVCVALDPRTGDLECVNAGHPPVAIITPAGAIRCLQVAEHHPLGVQPTTFNPQLDRMEPGHLLAMYSDGLTEVQVSAGKLLGVDGVNQFMADAITTTPAMKAADITTRLMKHVGELETNLLPEDDRSFLVAKWMT
jgi:serine phosphatase RsbU (regulator of sigma subunit)